MNKTIWIDMETGGLDPKTHEITQIAAILDIDGEIKDQFDILLRPSAENKVSPGALAIQKRELKEVMARPIGQAEGFAAYRDTLERWTTYGKASWGGQNCPFDRGFSKAFFATHGDVADHLKYFDACDVDLLPMVTQMRRMGSLRLPDAKLGTVCSHLGIVFDAHNAVGDISATRLAYYKLKGPHANIRTQDIPK